MTAESSTAAPHRHPTAAPAARRFYPGLEGLRGVLVLLVMAGHAGFPHNVFWIALPIFFVMSGFLITKIMLSAQRYGRLAGITAFLVNRTLRLAPVYLLFVAGLTALAIVADRPAALRGDLAWLWTWSFDLRLVADGWTADLYSHTWSIGVEIKLCLVWAIAALVLSQRSFFRFLVALVVLGPVIRVLTGLWLVHSAGLPYPVMIGILQGQFPTYLDAFAIGGLLAFPNVWDRLAPTRVLAWSLGAVVAVTSLIQVAVAVATGGAFPLWDFWAVAFPLNYGWVWGYSLVGPIGALLMISVMRGVPWLNRVLLWRPLMWLGERSYSIYLLHMPIFWVGAALAGYDAPVWSHLAILVACGPVAVAVAALSHRWVEKPFLRFKLRPPVGARG